MRAKLDAEIESARADERALALLEIKQLISEFAITRDELREAFGATRVPKSAPRYWDPHTGATWSGRGRRPKWLDGRDLDAYRLPSPEDPLTNENTDLKIGHGKASE
ncbi:H-NS family nucleoid-associated regulatory protein [Burkholderia ubonensis]|uniref:H-NS histone family protein n=1 Tax=Burkholderia ubonensis TaxID=101571 RepID=UPI0009B45E54|nr:H-NS histone family protein [Burkholderia ubonensis]